MFLFSQLQGRILLGKAIRLHQSNLPGLQTRIELTCPSGEKTVRAEGALSAMSLCFELARMPVKGVALITPWHHIYRTYLGRKSETL